MGRRSVGCRAFVLRTCECASAFKKKKKTKKQIGQIPITSGRKRDDLEAYSVEPNPTPILTIMYRLSQVVCPLDPWI